LPRRVAGDAAIGNHVALQRPAPVTAPASPARVSIGTIEVTVVAPAPPPIAPPAPPARARPSGADAVGQAGADVALRAARSAARRWFGAGQS
jgi:hypothetical protein